MASSRTFEGPAQAVRCARAFGDSLAGLGIQVRAGVHIGEVETVGDDVIGVTVHVAARIASAAAADEVLVSSTLKDLIAGSGLEFEDAGEHELSVSPTAGVSTEPLIDWKGRGPKVVQRNRSRT